MITPQEARDITNLPPYELLLSEVDQGIRRAAQKRRTYCGFDLRTELERVAGEQVVELLTGLGFEAGVQRKFNDSGISWLLTVEW